MSKVIPRARIIKPSSSSPTTNPTTSTTNASPPPSAIPPTTSTTNASPPPLSNQIETTNIGFTTNVGQVNSSPQPNHYSGSTSTTTTTTTSSTPEKRGNLTTTSRIKTVAASQQQPPKDISPFDDHSDLQYLYSSAGISLSKEQQVKFDRYSKRMVLTRTLEQFRLIAFVKQIFTNYVNPVTLCIIYHRQNFGENVMALFDDSDMLTDLYPLTSDKASVTICLNPITFTDLCLKIDCHDEKGSNTFYFQCEGEMQLLSIMSAFQKALLYNGQDAKYNKPSFHSLVSKYSHKKPKNPQKTPIPFSWCEKYVARYSSNEDLNLRKTTKNPLLNKILLGDDSSSDSSSLSSSPYGSLRFVSSSRRRFEDQEDDGGLASRHIVNSDDERSEEIVPRFDDDDKYFTKREPVSPTLQTNNWSQKQIVAETRTSPSTTSSSTRVQSPTKQPTYTQQEEDNDGDDDSKISHFSFANVATSRSGKTDQSSSPSPSLIPNEDHGAVTNSPTSTAIPAAGKKVIKRMVKRVPARSGSGDGGNTTTE
ncbi:hypothetical protein FDP41_000154 [Naegleria fowleri]|uniref:Uncharacterized protein n=1 Tax=Naegleria fowleri TaxID=5763 RepID=A0A6A5CIH5_NAEFO|nr:uncharacterized protein FDP41_000154 [Naegleria fowleri]KAF0985115.1 hypothetical protein FDP41_000154 [Naegleria fowleri]CAG4713042.1 unnamed protein product [Naegleria fowleri]